MSGARGGMRLAAGGCIAAGALLLLCGAAVSLRAWFWQERHAEAFAAADTPSTPSLDVAPASRAGHQPLRGEALALLRVPRLGIETVVAEGTDPRTLLLGPGHMEGSALPGEPDNCIIAGHRDAPFGRPDGDLRDEDKLDPAHLQDVRGDQARQPLEDTGERRPWKSACEIVRRRHLESEVREGAQARDRAVVGGGMVDGHAILDVLDLRAHVVTERGHHCLRQAP